jgi:quercetin dioxygenase-like cupin family protein
MQVTSFNESVEFDDSRVRTKLLLETSFSKEIRILLKEGQIMKEHKAPYPILIHILEGQIALGVQGVSYDMSGGDIISLEANVSHDLTAKENTIVRLTLSKFDSIDRLKEIAES